jgi:ssDNA-binding Zn-finger/Zn-ribbon topoisomerase 1
MPKKKCPICGGVAKYKNPPDGSEQYRCFVCPVCGHFVISLMAEDHLAKFPIKDRVYYSEKANAAEDGEVLIIQFLDDGSEALTIHRYDDKADWFG